MKMIKIIKLSASVISIGGVLGISSNIVSCGHSKDGPSDNNPTWADFKISATGATALAIVSSASPSAAGWDPAKDDDFKFLNKPIANEQDKTLTTVIISTINNDKATFLIAYNKQSYDDALWKCSVQPPSKQVGWNNFKNAAAGDETAPKLLAQARSSKVLDTFSWTYGDPSQTKWNQKDVAQWDTFGYEQKSDSFKGMGGTIKVNETDHTISAIISKKGKAGNYDADPIKVIITYSDGVVYNIKNWKFSKIEQLQSYEKVKTIFDAQVTLAKNWDDFIKSNWMTFGDDAKGNNHSSDNSIYKVLVRGGCIPYEYDKTKPIYDTNSIGDFSTNVEMKIIFNFKVHSKTNSSVLGYQLSLYFHYFCTDKISGGSAFNYTWTGEANQH